MHAAYIEAKSRLKRHRGPGPRFHSGIVSKHGAYDIARKAPGTHGLKRSKVKEKERERKRERCSSAVALALELVLSGRGSPPKDSKG